MTRPLPPRQRAQRSHHASHTTEESPTSESAPIPIQRNRGDANRQSAPKNGDNTTSSGYDESDHPESGDNSRHDNHQPAPLVAPVAHRVDVARIETVAMTAEEYDTAVDALAVLIAGWWRTHPDDTGQHAA